MISTKFNNSRENFDTFEKLLEIYSPFYKNSYPGKYTKVPSFEMLEQYEDPIFILDFTKIGYNYANKSAQMLDIDLDKTLQEGIEYSLRLFYENEKEVLLKEVFPELIRYARMFLENNKFPDFKATYSTHVKLRTGEYQWFVHEVSILGMAPDSGHVVGLKQLRNIHHIKKDNDLDLTFFEKDEYGIYRVIKSKSYDFLNRLSEEDDLCLSKRELEVLVHIKKGLSSKEIAQTLVISDHTVHNHRKNILRKSNGMNIMEIIQVMSQKRFI